MFSSSEAACFLFMKASLGKGEGGVGDVAVPELQH